MPNIVTHVLRRCAIPSDFALQGIGMASALENVFVLYRRTMLGAMVDKSATVLAVALTALEEAILRSTMVNRDMFFRKMLGKPDLSDAELAYQRKTWAASVYVYTP